MNKSIWQKQCEKNHPLNMQQSCPYCIGFGSLILPPADEVTKKVFGLIDDITDDYKKKHIKGVMSKCGDK